MLPDKAPSKIPPRFANSRGNDSRKHTRHSPRILFELRETSARRNTSSSRITGDKSQRTSRPSATPSTNSAPPPRIRRHHQRAEVERIARVSIRPRSCERFVLPHVSRGQRANQESRKSRSRRSATNRPRRPRQPEIKHGKANPSGTRMRRAMRDHSAMKSPVWRGHSCPRLASASNLLSQQPTTSSTLISSIPLRLCPPRCEVALADCATRCCACHMARCARDPSARRLRPPELQRRRQMQGPVSPPMNSLAPPRERNQLRDRTAEYLSCAFAGSLDCARQTLFSRAEIQTRPHIHRCSQRTATCPYAPPASASLPIPPRD